MLNKRGFVSLFFLSWFLIISAWVSLGYLQLRAEIVVAQQLQLSEQQDLALDSNLPLGSLSAAATIPLRWAGRAGNSSGCSVSQGDLKSNRI